MDGPDGARLWNAASHYSGYFRGVFQNQSVESPASNGYYVFDLPFNDVS